MNIEEKYNKLKEEVELLRTNEETLTREKIYKQAFYDGMQTKVIKTMGILSELKDKQQKLTVQKKSVINTWSTIFKGTCGLISFVLIYPTVLISTIKVIENTANTLMTLLTIIGGSVLITGLVALSCKIINKVSKSKIEKIKDTKEYKELEEKLKEKEKEYEASIKSLENAKEEYLDKKLEHEKQSKLLSEKELILSWFEKTIINCDELPLEEDKTVQKPHTKRREIK